MATINDIFSTIEQTNLENLDQLIMLKQVLDSKIKELKTQLPRKKPVIEYEEHEVIIDKILTTLGDYVCCFDTSNIPNVTKYTTAQFVKSNWPRKNLPKEGQKVLIRRRKIKNESEQWAQPFKVIKVIE